MKQNCFRFKGSLNFQQIYYAHNLPFSYQIFRRNFPQKPLKQTCLLQNCFLKDQFGIFIISNKDLICLYFVFLFMIDISSLESIQIFLILFLSYNLQYLHPELSPLQRCKMKFQEFFTCLFFSILDTLNVQYSFGIIILIQNMFLKKTQIFRLIYQLYKFFIEEMIDKEQEKLRYELGIHHRQNMRKNIDQKMIDNIQISNNPSVNYDKAYKGLYHEELQKSVDLYNYKKNKEKAAKTYDAEVGKKHQDEYGQGSVHPYDQSNGNNLSFSRFQKSTLTPVEMKNLNYKDTKYEDYDELKEGKALDYTYNNYDGGKKFHHNNDLHAAYQALEQNKMRLTLKGQLDYKDHKNHKEYTKKMSEEQAMYEGKLKRMQMEANRLKNQKQNNQKHNQTILYQIQVEKEKKGRKSFFNYDTMTRHNPITNPIERRVDNPYILKQMQNRSQPHCQRY